MVSEAVYKRGVTRPSLSPPLPTVDVEPVTAASGTHEYECTENDCGYTIFPAAGREDKFFGASFKCPQCGAGKDAFVDNGPA